VSTRFSTTESEDDSRAWLITYADMITLILTFFVMLVAMSEISRSQFEEAMESLRKSMSGEKAVIERREKSQAVSMMIGELEHKLMAKVDEVVQKSPLASFIRTQFDRKRLIITVQDQALFQPGQAVLGPQAGEALEPVLKILKTFPEYRVNIKGHTDSTPISTPAFPSNWELSAIRATTVLRYLMDEGISAHRMTATGLADLDPIAPNTTPENRALNRRVEFVLEKEK